jgi:hypothetical protein
MFKHDILRAGSYYPKAEKFRIIINLDFIKPGILIGSVSIGHRYFDWRLVLQHIDGRNLQQICEILKNKLQKHQT